MIECPWMGDSKHSFVEKAWESLAHTLNGLSKDGNERTIAQWKKVIYIHIRNYYNCSGIK